MRERLAGRRPIGGPGPAHPGPAPAPPPVPAPLRVAGPGPRSRAGIGGSSPTRPGLARGVRPGPRPLACGLLPVWDYFPFARQYLSLLIKVCIQFCLLRAGGAAEGRAVRVREEGVNLKRRSSRGSALGADGPAAGESRLSRGGGAWPGKWGGGGRGQAGTYWFPRPSAASSAAKRGWLRAACGGGLPGRALPSANTVPNSPEIKQVTRARSVCLSSLQDSRSRAGDRVAFSPRHPTSSSASRQYWKLVAAIDHPGNIFILLNMEEKITVGVYFLSSSSFF